MFGRSRKKLVVTATLILVAIGIFKYSTNTDHTIRVGQNLASFHWNGTQLDGTQSDIFNMKVNNLPSRGSEKNVSLEMSREQPGHSSNILRTKNKRSVPLENHVTVEGAKNQKINPAPNLDQKAHETPQAGLVDTASRNFSNNLEPSVGAADKQTSILVEERRNRVGHLCSDAKLTSQLPRVGSSLYNSKYKFYYCPVEKVASTFWRRFVYQLQHTNPVKSPFDVSIGTALSSMGDLHLPHGQQSGKELNKLLNESTKLLFVRDPHSRIFSAYIDKLLAPNPYFWKVWGLPAVMRYRANHHHIRGHSHCGHDVTFKEFVEYVINVASRNDGHVKPINDMCTPCAVSYTIIGKMESFVDDLTMLFRLLHLNETSLRIHAMKQETTFDAIADSATDALSGGWLTSSLRCITKEAVLQRIWRKNQIRGFVSWRNNLNLPQSEIQRMNSKDFIKLLSEASKLSEDKNELKVQKAQAMKEAYMSLDNNLLNSISKVYGNDIKLFGYSEIPPCLKMSIDGDFIDTKAFDYSHQWDLSKVLSKNHKF